MRLAKVGCVLTPFSCSSLDASPETGVIAAASERSSVALYSYSSESQSFEVRGLGGRAGVSGPLSSGYRPVSHSVMRPCPFWCQGCIGGSQSCQMSRRKNHCLVIAVTEYLLSLATAGVQQGCTFPRRHGCGLLLTSGVCRWQVIRFDPAGRPIVDCLISTSGTELATVDRQGTLRVMVRSLCHRSTS